MTMANNEKIISNMGGAGPSQLETRPNAEKKNLGAFSKRINKI